MSCAPGEGEHAVCCGLVYASVLCQVTSSTPLDRLSSKTRSKRCLINRLMTRKS